MDAKQIRIMAKRNAILRNAQHKSILVLSQELAEHIVEIEMERDEIAKNLAVKENALTKVKLRLTKEELQRKEKEALLEQFKKRLKHSNNLIRVSAEGLYSAN